MTGSIREPKVSGMGRQRRLGVKVCFQDQRGLGLVESLVAVAILGIAVVAFIVALSAGMLAVREQGREVVAQRLARSQLEHIKSYPYNPEATTYPLVAYPPGYTVAVVVSSVPDADVDIQKIAVTVSDEEGTLLVVEDYKVNR